MEYVRWSCYSSLVTRYSSLVTCYSSLVTCYSSLVTFYSLLVTFNKRHPHNILNGARDDVFFLKHSLKMETEFSVDTDVSHVGIERVDVDFPESECVDAVGEPELCGFLPESPAAVGAFADELAQLAGELVSFPIRPSTGSERAPQIYSTEDLKQILLKVAADLGCRVSVTDLDEIFRRLLTPWLPTFLGEDEGVMAVQKEPTLDAEQEDMAQQAATTIRNAGTPVELEILALKIADVPYATIGQRLNMSRPTVIKHKKKILAKVEAELSGLNEACQTRAIELLATIGHEGPNS